MIYRSHSAFHQPRPFIDWRRVRVSGGSGGDGSVSLARVYRNPRAGPDGGDGGAGGHVIFQVGGVRWAERVSRKVVSNDKLATLCSLM